jgi:hypothetical protein
MILARAQAAAQPEPRRRRWVRGLVVAGSIIGFLAIIGGVVYVLAGHFLHTLFHAITHV